jgi:hypothetical protein
MKADLPQDQNTQPNRHRPTPPAQLPSIEAHPGSCSSWSSRLGGNGTCRTMPRLRHLSVSMLVTPLSRSIAPGVSASGSDVRPPPLACGMVSHNAAGNACDMLRPPPALRQSASSKAAARTAPPAFSYAAAFSSTICMIGPSNVSWRPAACGRHAASGVNIRLRSTARSDRLPLQCHALP